jgi:hypothetical protein
MLIEVRSIRHILLVTTLCVVTQVRRLCGPLDELLPDLIT